MEKLQLKTNSDNAGSENTTEVNEEMNKEVRDMIDLGLLDKNWAEGLSKVEAEIKLSQILSNDQSFKHSQAAPFANEDMNKEVSDMIDLGLLDKYWADGLSKVEAEIKFNKVLNGQLSSTSIGTPQFPVNKSSTPERKKNLPRIKNYKLIPLSSEDQIFKDIFAYFKSCRIERKINAIQRVENEKQKKLFEEETHQLERLHGKEFDLHIQDLYHGSNAARNLICSRGLDQRLGQVGLFGKGIYFSDNLKKCEKYLTNNKGSAIYKCSVILGDIKEYPSGVAAPELKQEPEKENGDYYDSVKGNFDGYNEYIIYDNRRCLIKYRIVLEGTEDEDSDIEVMVAKQEAEDKMMETWKRHMHYLVNTCRHENEEDAKTEQEIRNIEKIRLEIRRRREIQTGEPQTEVTYDMLRKERKTWKKYVNKAETNKMPSQQKSDHEKSHSIATGQHSNPENASQQKSDREKSHSIATGQHSNPDILTDSKDDYMQLIFDKTLSEFVEVTHCEDTELARNIILNQNWNLDEAINEYFTLML